VAIASRDTGKRIETWLSPALARELKELADRDRCSVSAVIRNAVEDRLLREQIERTKDAERAA
jgi:predicted transcriptional regulator